MRRTGAGRVAFGGVTAALALVLLIGAGLLPTASYALAATAGILLMPLVVEFGAGWAFGVFAGVGLLGLLLVPDKEAALLYLCFAGWYPIVKAYLERIKSRVLEWVVKLAVFNVTIVGFYQLTVWLLAGAAEFEGSFLMKYGIWLLWLLADVTFVVYDVALSKLITLYSLRLRPKLQKLLDGRTR